MESSEKSCNFRRFDDLVRTERYFTATLLPLVLLTNRASGVLSSWLRRRRFRSGIQKSGKQNPKGTPKNDFQDVEVITEFRIAQELKVAHLWPEEANVEPSEEGEPSTKTSLMS